MNNNAIFWHVGRKYTQYVYPETTTKSYPGKSKSSWNENAANSYHLLPARPFQVLKRVPLKPILERAIFSDFFYLICNFTWVDNYKLNKRTSSFGEASLIETLKPPEVLTHIKASIVGSIYSRSQWGIIG